MKSQINEFKEQIRSIRMINFVSKIFHKNHTLYETVRKEQIEKLTSKKNSIYVLTELE